VVAAWVSYVAPVVAGAASAYALASLYRRHVERLQEAARRECVRGFAQRERGAPWTACVPPLHAASAPLTRALRPLRRRYDEATRESSSAALGGAASASTGSAGSAGGDKGGAGEQRTSLGEAGAAGGERGGEDAEEATPNFFASTKCVLRRSWELKRFGMRRSLLSLPLPPFRALCGALARASALSCPRAPRWRRPGRVPPARCSVCPR